MYVDSLYKLFLGIKKLLDDTEELYKCFTVTLNCSNIEELKIIRHPQMVVLASKTTKYVTFTPALSCSMVTFILLVLKVSEKEHSHQQSLFST